MGTERSLIASEPAILSESNRLSLKTEEGTEFWPPILGYHLKITDSLVAAFTGLLFVATVALWRATNRLVRGAEQTAERQLRAYVSIREGSMALLETDKGRVFFQVTIFFQNYGQTPAYALKSWTRVEIGREEVTDFHLGEGEAESVCGPGGDFNVTPTCGPIAPEIVPELISGVSKAYVWGHVVYRDAFENQRYFRFYITNGRVQADGRTWPLAPNLKKAYQVS